MQEDKISKKKSIKEMELRNTVEDGDKHRPIIVKNVKG